MTEIPEMSELYRQLLEELATKFGGSLDEANADAIAYAAAELYHRNFEPRLWEEKSAHDVLDLFGVPRAGVFSPYSLADRLVVFQRRSSKAEYVDRAHDVLTALGVPRHDTAGNDHSLKTRLDMFLSRSGGTMAEQQLRAAGGGEDPADAEEVRQEPQEPPTGLADFGDGEDTGASAVTGAGGNGEAPSGTGDGQGDRGGGEQEPEAARGAVQVLETADTGEAVEAKTEPPDTNGDGDAAVAMAEAVAEVVAEAVTDAAATSDDVEAEVEVEVEVVEVVEEDVEAAEAGAEEDVEEEMEAADVEDAVDVEADDMEEVVEETASIEVLTELPVNGLVEEELPEDELTAGNGANGAPATAPEPVEVPSFEENGPTTQAAGVDVTDAPGAAPLVEAVRALEQAARVEAELAEVGPEGPGGVDLVRLSSTLNGLQAEMVALRTLVESLGNELRERLESIHEEVLTATGALQPAQSPATNGPSLADQITRVMPPVEPVDTAPAEKEKRRPLRRVWLVILLLLVALLLAGLIVIIVAVGWDRIQSEVTGVISSPLLS